MDKSHFIDYCISGTLSNHHLGDSVVRWRQFTPELQSVFRNFFSLILRLSISLGGNGHDLTYPLGFMFNGVL